jgi:hypothetical protein
MDDPDYSERLMREAAVWGAAASDGAATIAPDWAGHRRHRDHLPGVATYEVADLSHLALGEGQCDAVVANGIMHHLAGADAGAVTLLAPTCVSYRDKMRGLARFRWRAPDRIKARMETRGFSPFEGAGREVDWVGKRAASA